jgi:predicted secreted Zn-dependent protease
MELANSINPKTITITLPATIYSHVERQSQLMRRSIAEELVAVVTEYWQKEALANDIEQELIQLDLFSDSELWQAAKINVSAEKTEYMQELVEKQQSVGLTESENQQAQLLSHLFNRMMLVRAKAAALLKKRGYDLSPLIKIT